MSTYCKWKSNVWNTLLIVFMLITGCNTQRESVQLTSPVDAKDAVSTFQVAEGFKIELIAAEPLITDPVDIEIDEYGRLYVVEMHGYPLDKSGSGKIILLSDEDGDGSMDSRTVFAEGLILPTSVMRWKKGIMVTDAPDILYLEDTDGDGKADVKETILTGFALSNPQHNLNSPMYGMDNWIYVAHEGTVNSLHYKEEFGDEGSEIIFPNITDAPRLPKNANKLSIRFHPDRKQLEMLSSRSQFGHAFDEWGHLFGCNNANQGYQEVIASRYLERNPNLLISNATQSMSDHQNNPEVFPTTARPDRQLLTSVGVITSACGLTTYLGGAFPAPYDKNVTFVAEPVSNLVHVDVLRDSGASFVASRILPNSEFLSSTDAWSRPVNLYVGPDGALYVLDYYRRVIESPEWMSDEAIHSGNLYDGTDRGRIYRITPEGVGPADWTKGLTLGDASNEALVEQLASPNSWWRLNAQRLLVDRADMKAVPALIRMANNAQSPMGRLHALWTLQGLEQLTEELIEKALNDTEAGIRENAIKLAELHLSDSPELVRPLMRLVKDADAKVRFQLLLTLGFVNTPEAAEARNELLLKDVNDQWVQIAALSAPFSETGSLLSVVLDNFEDNREAYGSLVRRLTTMIGAKGTREAVHQIIKKSTSDGAEDLPPWQGPMLEGLADGIASRKLKSPESVSVFEGEQNILVKTFFEHRSGEVRKASLEILKIIGLKDESLARRAIEKAVLTAGDSDQPENKRAESINFISLRDPTPHTLLLKKLLIPQEQPAIQLAALMTLSKIPNTTVSEYVIQQWPVLTSEIREAAIGTFLENQERITILLNALETNIIQPASVNRGRSVRLMMNRDLALRNRARVLFTRNEEEGRRINKEYQEALELKGDISNGEAVYLQNCAICHQIRGKIGVELGPDMGSVHNWPPEIIMANILDPSLSISSGYDLWEVELNNGESLQGIISDETASAITLRNNGRPDRTINREDVKSLKSLDMSAMPSGFEKKISKQEMADLLAFLRKN